MDLAEIRDRVRTNIVDSSTIRPRINNVRLDRVIDSAIEFVARATGSYFEDVQLTVLDNTDSVAFTPDLEARFISLRLINESITQREIRIRGIDEINDYRSSGIPPASVPWICTVSGPRFFVAPAVFLNRTFNITFAALPPALVNGTDVPKLKHELHPSIVSKASALGWTVLEEPIQAKKYDDETALLLSIASPDNVLPRPVK